MVAVLGVGGYFYWSQKKTKSITDQKISENKNSNTYENKDLGFSLEYPKDWFYFTKGATPTSAFGMEFSDDKNYIDNGALGPGAFPNKRISLTLYKTYKTLAQYYTEDLQAKKAKIISTQETTIGGIKGVIAKSEFQGTYLSAYVMKGGNIYTFETIIKNQADTQEVEKVFDSIVYSLKFQ